VTDEQLNALVERLEAATQNGAWPGIAAAASAIRQLMREKDDRYRQGQHDMRERIKLAMKAEANDPSYSGDRPTWAHYFDAIDRLEVFNG
jgi:hypothetical protein